MKLRNGCIWKIPSEFNVSAMKVDNKGIVMPVRVRSKKMIGIDVLKATKPKVGT